MQSTEVKGEMNIGQVILNPSMNRPSQTGKCVILTDSLNKSVEFGFSTSCSTRLSI